MTGAGGLGKYTNVTSPKQLPLRLGTLQKARGMERKPRRDTGSCMPPTPSRSTRPEACDEGAQPGEPHDGCRRTGKYTNVMKPKQLPLRLGTLQKACAAALSRLIEIPHRDLNASKQAVFFGGERRVRSALSV
jgi:hypothetical protein